MGITGWWQWLIVLLIVVLIFGTKKLRNIGQDLGGAVKGFKDGMKEGDKSAGAEPPPKLEDDGQTIEGQAREKADKSA